MGTRLVAEGVAVASIGRRRLVYFDEIERVEDRSLVLADGRIRVSPSLAGEVAAILRGPEPESAAIERYVATAHAPRRAARALLSAAEARRATDVHLEPTPDGALVRFRLEGELNPFCSIPPAATKPLVAALKGLAGCLPYRADLVQEGRIPRDGIAADIRASFVPTASGERVALRLFGRFRRLEDLGLSDETLASFDRLLRQTTGLVLVAGATGAGKTTTLYATLARLTSTRAGAHLSLEDPVEQRLRVAGVPVDQIELDASRGLTGESLLAAALRQDVDVLSVGEVRTPAEARLALHAAHTGRLVLAGVHAGSCEEARQRMLDLGVDAPLLAQTLRGVLHQALVVTECGCDAGPVCARCGGLRRRRELRARLLVAQPSLERVA